MSESTWSPTPAADTLGTLQKAIAGYVLMPTDDEVLETALMGIRRAIDRLNTRKWNWAATYSTVTFVAGTQEYTLDQSFKAPKNFALRNTSAVDTSRLKYLPWGTFLKEAQWDHATTGTGSPSFYSATNVNLFGVIRLDVSPDASFVANYPTGRLWYYRRVQYPTATGTALDVPSEVVGFVQEWAEGFTANRHAVAKAASAYARAENLLRELRADDNDVQTDWE
jgi:hypothetical protein